MTMFTVEYTFLVPKQQVHNEVGSSCTRIYDFQLYALIQWKSFSDNIKKYSCRMCHSTKS